MRVLLFGGKGWLGSRLYEYLIQDPGHEVIISDLRVDNTEDVRVQLEEVKPDRVVCTIGRTHGPGCPNIDYLEGNRDKLVENLRDNLFAPLSLALLCQTQGHHLTVLGTGCIFNGPGKFSETDKPNFTGSSYSIVKGNLDQLLRLLPGVLSVRIRLPISSRAHSRNLLTKLLQFKTVSNIPNSVTVIEDLFPILVKAIYQGDTGALNLTNPGTITNEAIVRLYKTLINPSHTYEVMSPGEQKGKIERSNVELDTTLLESRYGPVPTIDESIRRILLQYSEV